MPPKKPRLSLTKAQLQEAVGAELLTLCQTITADGVLTDAEIHELRGWLQTNRGQDMPAIEFLTATVERILADGKVTADERKELYAAIEKVLPIEVRRLATAGRKAVEAAEREHDREVRKFEKEQERIERERSRPLYFADFMVAGVHYDGRPEVIRRYAHEDEPVYLYRDPANAFSRNAVEVRLSNGYMIGYVPEEFAPELAPLLAQGFPQVAQIIKVLREARVPIPIVHAYVHRHDADVKDLVFPRDLPAKRDYQSERRSSEVLPVARPVKRVQNKGCSLLMLLLCGLSPFLVARVIAALH